MKVAMPFLAAIVLTGCGDGIPDAMKQKILADLKDPASAQFGKPLFAKDRGCVAVNAKNSYGGYTGFTNAHLSGSGNYWHLETMDGPSCTEATLEELVKKDAKEAANEAEVLGTAKKLGVIPATINSVFDESDNPCVAFASSVTSSYRIALDEEFKGKTERAAEWMSQYNRELERLKKGDCTKAQ